MVKPLRPDRETGAAGIQMAGAKRGLAKGGWDGENEPAKRDALEERRQRFRTEEAREVHPALQRLPHEGETEGLAARSSRTASPFGFYVPSYLSSHWESIHPPPAAGLPKETAAGAAASDGSPGARFILSRGRDDIMMDRQQGRQPAFALPFASLPPMLLMARLTLRVLDPLRPRPPPPPAWAWREWLRCGSR